MNEFKKYHGLGNDFILLSGEQNQLLNNVEVFTPSLIKNLCNRNFGIGADGIPAPISFDLDFKNLLRTEQTLINKFAGKSAGDPDATKSKKLKKKKKGGKKFKKKKSSFKFDFGGKK